MEAISAKNKINVFLVMTLKLVNFIANYYEI